MEDEKELREVAKRVTKGIREVARPGVNEAEFRKKFARLIEDFAQQSKIDIIPKEEYTVARGRVDAVYNRLIIEYEQPHSLRAKNVHGKNRHAIEQVKSYIEDVAKQDRLKEERLAGVVTDGVYFIFLRKIDKNWVIEDPLEVNLYSVERFLRLIDYLSSGRSLTANHLIEDFGSGTLTAQRTVRALYDALENPTDPLVVKLFDQWKIFFGEVTGYETGSSKLEKKKELRAFARGMGINPDKTDPPRLFFSVHTYYAILIKLLAWLAVSRYRFKMGPPFGKLLVLPSEDLRGELSKLERGGIFREFGIRNFLEGDFFSWYLKAWNENIADEIREVIKKLNDYDPTTLEAIPEETRDLLKKLYHYLMPREIRHDLGEYYTPDWLAQRLLLQIDVRLFDNPKTVGAWRRVLNYAQQNMLKLRFLDPACGSGTFLVLIINRFKQLNKELLINERQLLKAILSNVVGIDLNPLAVITARTNYILALGELLEHADREIDIPVYLADSILTPSLGEDLFRAGKYSIKTTVGEFEIPREVGTREQIDVLANVIDESVESKVTTEAFLARIEALLDIGKKELKKTEQILARLYERMLELHKEGLNGIWARIIKNAFMPIFIGESDYVVGNPPWVNWENLPENYRKGSQFLWFRYGMVATKGKGKEQFELGKQKRDISSLMTYVSLDKYLKTNGKLGFVITQSVFKTGASAGFREFKLPNGVPVRVLHVDDMMELNPFEGTSNRTSVVILQKGRPTTYPMRSYLYWKKIAKGKSISLEATLDEVIQITERKQFVAEPVKEKDPTSPWITGRPKALKGIRKILGPSDYKAHAGVCGWANSIYWVNIIDKRPDGLVVISNITEGAKRDIESIYSAIEPDLLYPLLRSGDLKKWKAEPSAWIILPHTPETAWKSIPENEMEKKYFKTFQYFKKFKEILENRAGYKLLRKGHPFYILVDIHEETFAPWKVVWTRIGNIEAAVVSKKDGKPIIPQETITLVAFENKPEAYYLAAMVNSTPFQFAAISYSQQGGKSMGSPHILENICIPKFDGKDKLHLNLAELSESAHRITRKNDERTISKVEEEIDKIAAQIWGITKGELDEIKYSLAQLKKN